MTTIAVVDTETVGLNPRLHGIWEVGLILHDMPDADGKAQDDREFVWQLPVDLSVADPDALRISRFYERRWPTREEHEPNAETVGLSGLEGRGPIVLEPQNVVPWARRFCSLTAGTVLVGAVPSFDERRLDRLVRELGSAPAWHYRPICVEALAVGFIRGAWEKFSIDTLDRKPISDEIRRWQGGCALESVDGKTERGEIALPWSSSTVTRALGIGRRKDAHTALGDCRWALDVWRRVMEGKR